ncbi:MAG: HNH endonuclease [Oleispira sp.]|nr:HNH endonuclease [Oleispira sp.]MBL4880583.1 HNH endonuclease [Oleispira sp.]
MASNKDASSNLFAAKAADRCQLVLHVQAGDGANHQDTNSDANLGGRWLLPDAARRLACDAGLLVVREDSAGNVLDIGRRSRIIPIAMSRALAIRDGGCQFPGCCENRYVEGHHIKHWADGGETKLDNLVTLCRYHHRELHRGAFFLSVNPISSKEQGGGKAVHFRERLCFSTVDRYFNSPINRTEDFVIAANPAEFTCACCGFAELEKRLEEDVSEVITATTAVTKWSGESMDLSMVIAGLLWSEGGRAGLG